MQGREVDALFNRGLIDIGWHRIDADFGISILLSAPTYTLTQIQLAQVYVDTQGSLAERQRPPNRRLTKSGLCSPDRNLGANVTRVNRTTDLSGSHHCQHLSWFQLS